MKCRRLRWLWTWKNKVDQHQQMTWHPKSLLPVETWRLQATWILCLYTLPSDSGTLISKWNAKFTLIQKEDFGPLGNGPGNHNAQVSHVWRCVWFRKCSPFPGHTCAWWLLMHWLQPQSRPWIGLLKNPLQSVVISAACAPRISTVFTFWQEILNFFTIFKFFEMHLYLVYFLADDN